MLGGLLFARQLSRFTDLDRRAVRVIEYPGVSRAEIEMRESPGQRGYAVGFAGLLRFVMERLPATEQISSGVRLAAPVYPEVAVREFVANALIHQDLTIRGTAPLIEIFRDRVEVTNPGLPLNAPERLLDLPARSRNESLAFAMRNVGLCEERGSGIDRAVAAIEQHQLPAPEIAVHGDHTRVTMFGPRPLAQMTQADRLRACYQHACLLWVQRTPMGNATLRRRLAITDRDYSIASRILSDALDAGLIRAFDPSSASKRHAKYVPHWAER
jgi:predicted HTH transcriptional regulator